jgi:peroxiredoxin
MSDERVKPGQEAPNFALTNTKGEEIRLSDFRGNKSVYLVFNRGFF